ncbi:Type III secretion system chaperone [Sulfidibacter corallicola]|uniref:Type III secretion system chaperone n=1 Tax=Sulfidibacter corallicola TaxID=2818388 RepID=A0A8A4TTH0_SULCO|nr:CesT family type III secretion system chaperone [Sulfidibacter corallicola]QTD49835.1 type III secretion system chaperone [Sulfidibacter corallicola]
MCEHQDRVNQWLSSYSGDAFEALRLEEDGSCSLHTDQGLELSLHLLPGHVELYINITLSACNLENRAQFFEQALTLNHYQHDMHGGAIAFDPQTSELVFSSTMTIEGAEFDDFDRELMCRIEVAVRLREHLQSQQQRAAQPAPVYADGGNQPERISPAGAAPTYAENNLAFFMNMA